MLDYQKNGIKWGEKGAYTYMLEESGLIDKIGSISCILECGARAGEDSIALADIFKCPVHAFEPNPVSIEFCKKHFGERKDIFLNECAVSDYDGRTTFYSVNTDKYPNVGASSLYKFDMDSKHLHPPEVLRAGNEIQYEIDVEVKRLDTYCKDKQLIPEALFMDIQGSELNALKGLGDYIGSVKLIGLETQYISSYKGGDVFSSINEFLTSHGFQFAWCWQTHGNTLPPMPNPLKEHWWDMLFVKI